MHDYYFLFLTSRLLAWCLAFFFLLHFRCVCETFYLNYQRLFQNVDGRKLNISFWWQRVHYIKKCTAFIMFWNTNVGAVKSIMLFFIRLKRKIDQNKNHYCPFRKRFQWPLFCFIWVNITDFYSRSKERPCTRSVIFTKCNFLWASWGRTRIIQEMLLML